MISLEFATRRFSRVSFLASFVFASVSLGACGGGGSPPTPKPSAKPTPPATPTPVASPGASLQYAGSMSQTITTTYADPGPVPSGTPQAVGVQTLSWNSHVDVTSSPAPGTGTGTVDVTTADTESMTSPSQTTQTVSVATYQFPAGGSGDVYLTALRSVNGTPGVASSITTVATEYATGNGLVDILPEKTGASWTDNGAMTQDELDPGGGTVQRSVAAGGAYTSTATFPALGGGASVTTRAIADNADGSGSYKQTNLIGGTPNAISYGAPANGSVVITDVAASSSSSAPAPVTTSLPVWYAVPVVLYAETETVAGAVTVPSACKVAAQFGSTATEIDDDSSRTDTVLGTIETLVRKTYDVSGTTVCVQSSDTLAAYYDYSGANVALINFFGTDWQTTVTTQTLGLTSASASSSSRSVGASSSAVVRPVAAGFESVVAKVRRDRERAVEAALSQKEIR